MSPLSTGTRAAIVIASLLLAPPASTMASEQEGPDSLLLVTRVCQSGALYLCDQYVAPPYTLTYSSEQLRINGYLYKDFGSHKGAIAKRIASGAFGGFDLSFYLQQRGDSLRNNGVSQRETSRRLRALAESLDNDRVNLEESDEAKFYVHDRKEEASYAVNIWSDAELAQNNALPPPGIESLDRLASILQAGRPVFVLGKTRRGPASCPSDDSSFVVLWNRAHNPDAKATERDLENLRAEYGRQGDTIHAGFCRDLLGCLMGKHGGRP